MTLETIRHALYDAAAAAIATLSNTDIFYDNQVVAPDLVTQVNNFVVVRVNSRQFQQSALGETPPTRILGSLDFFVYTKIGSGVKPENTIVEKLQSSIGLHNFSGVVVREATLLPVRHGVGWRSRTVSFQFYAD